MKPAFALLLIALACCYSSVSSDMCEPVDDYLQAMLDKSDDDFEEIAEKYANDEDGVDASKKLKECADELSDEQKSAYFELAKNVMAKCKKSWKEDQE